MSTRAAPVGGAGALVDLEAAHARVGRRLRWQWAWWLLAITPLVVLTALNPLAIGGQGSWTWYWPILLLAVVTVPVAATAISRHRQRRAQGLASPALSSVGSVLSSAPGPDLWRAVQAVFASTGFTSVRLLDAHTMQGSRWHLGTRSWLVVRVEGCGPGRGRVTAWAHPDPGWFGSPVDYGRNRRHANAVLGAVPGVLDPAREPDVPSRA